MRALSLIAFAALCAHEGKARFARERHATLPAANGTGGSSSGITIPLASLPF